MLTAVYAAGHVVDWGHGRATVSAFKLEWEEERREAADKYGAALAGALGRYEREGERGNAVAAQYAESRKQHARENQALQRRIAHAARGASHTFSPDFVRLYNEAIGIQTGSLPEALCSSASSRNTGAGSRPCEGILDRFGGVNEGDLLAHITWYGQRCRGLEAQVLGWQELERGWQ